MEGLCEDQGSYPPKGYVSPAWESCLPHRLAVTLPREPENQPEEGALGGNHGVLGLEEARESHFTDGE